MDVEKAISEYGHDPLALLRACGGYYECPKDKAGKRLCPLVGYAGKDGKGRHFVGDIYANFAKAEENPQVLFFFAHRLRVHIFDTIANFDVFCGAPMGGIAFAAMLGLTCKKRFMFMEKKVIAVGTSSSREESTLEIGRHEIKPGDHVFIVEDVTNNFSTTEIMVQVITKAGGQAVGIVSLLNRSVNSVEEFKTGNLVLPVISLVTKPIKQYEQDDPAVLADIESGNVVWKPKNEWPRLMAAMENK